MSAEPARRVEIFDANPRLIARHSPSITCPVTQVAASIGEWFPYSDPDVRDVIRALQRTLCSGGCADRLAELLGIVVEPATDR